MDVFKLYRLSLFLLCLPIITLSAVAQSFNPVSFLQEKAEGLSLQKEDLEELRVSSAYIAEGRRYFYLQQMYQDIDIEHAMATLVLDESDVILAFNHNFYTELTEWFSTVSQQPISYSRALHAACNHLGLSSQHSRLKDSHIRSLQLPNIRIYSGGAASSDDIPVEMMWINSKGGMIKSFKVGVHMQSGDAYWEVWVDADSGNIIQQRDKILHCSFDQPDSDHNHHHSSQSLSPASDNFLEEFNSETYYVYPLFVANPEKGDRVVVEDPNDLIASPYGWHDINGEEGPEFFDTRGNNVYAQEDFNYNNTGGKRADGGDRLNFNFEIDFSKGPKSYLDASLTNLFYWVNINHDIFYHYGFDEESGNFQFNNYGRGGLGGDQVYADAQDGSGKNNAQFLALGDGLPGRMEMFIWGSAEAVLEISGDSEVTGEWKGSESGFQGGVNSISRRGPQKGELVLALNNQGGTSEACESDPFQNAAALAGNIALIDRGTCLFTEKVFNAQQAGAIACVICNNVTPGTITMGGSNSQVTIPAMMLSKSDCDKIKRALSNGRTLEATVRSSGLADNLDSSLDNMIVTHEYGHGISIRLTGGRNNSNCLNNNEQMGEGWSDYFGLMLTTDWTTAQADDRRPVGNWLLKQSDINNGIRPYPYSYNKSINPMTYGDIKRFSVPHGLGAVWCSMLWDMTWEIINQEGNVSTDIYHGDGGNNIALRLVMEGLKLQNCTPGFLDGRDAILQADQMLYDGRHQYAIWKAFARRGLGAKADQGSSFSVQDGKSSTELPDWLITKAISFEAKDSIASIQLSWQSIREIENAAYRIMRSEDNKIFDEIYSVPGLEFSFDARSLTYEDKDVEPGKWYYYKLESKDNFFRTRIQGVDSAIIVQTSDITTFPNPSSGLMNVVISRDISDPVTFELSNIQGQKLREWRFPNPQILYSTYTFDLTDLASGTYFIRMFTSEENEVRKILIR